MKTPKVSVIVPIYNVEKYLKRCVDSIINQTIKDIEIILVDDGSPDNCALICDDYASKDNRIKVIHKRNEGLGFARNSGLGIATGEFVAFLDSDDYVELDMYEHLYTTAVEYKLDTIYCGLNLRRASGTIVSINQVDEFVLFEGKQKVDEFLLDMVGSDPGYHSDVKYQMSSCLALYSRALIVNNRVSFYSEREYISEDLLFNIDYLTNAKALGILPKSFYYYCYNSTSLTNAYKPSKFSELIKFHKALDKKLNCLFVPTLYKNNLYRLMLLNLRVAITQEVNFQHEIAFFKRWLNIARMCDDYSYKELFKTYPFLELPIKHLLFFLSAKYRLVPVLMLILSIDILSNNITSEIESL